MSEDRCPSTYLRGGIVTLRCFREAGHKGKHLAEPEKWSTFEWWPQHEVKR